MENELNARFQHAVIGECNTSTSSIPKKGEIIFNNTLDNFRVGTDGNTPYSSLTDFLHNFTGADTSSDGTSGLVPTPLAGDQTKFLRGDGTWQDAGGGGGSYTLPVATSSVLGGIKIGYTQNSNNYPVQLGSNTGDTGTDSRAYVNVPWYNTTYQFFLNGTRTYDSDATGTNLSSPDGTINGIYAPTASGTSGNMLKSNGNNNAPTWDSLENIIGKKTANYVLAGNGTTSDNGVVSWQQLSLSSLSDAPNTGTLTLNGTGFSVYSPTASLSKTWYAPTTSGTQYDLLQSNGSNNDPTWLTPSSTGLLKFTSDSGWSIDTSTYLTNHQTLYNLTLKLGGTTSETYIPATNDTYEFDVPLATSSQIGIAKVWSLNNSAPSENSTSSGTFHYYNRADINRYSTSNTSYKDKIYTQNEDLAVGGSASTDVSSGTLYTGENVYYEDYREYTTVSSVNSVIIRCKNKRGYYLHPQRLQSYYIVLKDSVPSGLKMYLQKVDSESDPNPVNYQVYNDTSPLTDFITDINILPTNITLTFACGEESGTSNLFFIYHGIRNVYPVLAINTYSYPDRYYTVRGSGYNGTSGTKYLCEDGQWKIVNTYDIASVNNGTNPGLLQIAADVNPDSVYINAIDVVAIPVFYTKDEEYQTGTTYIYEEGTTYEKGCYKPSEDKYVGHYVNLYDIINGLISNDDLISILRTALEVKQ